MTALVALVIFGMAAVSRPVPAFRNLQILPKDIPEAMLDSIMESYNTALGVSCDFCHSRQTGFPDRLDFASDSNHMKTEARDMMRMTIDINQKNFWHNKNIPAVYLNRVSCITCHRGVAYPED